MGTLFLASGELNKAQKQIMKDLKGPKCLSMQTYSDLVVDTENMFQDQSMFMTKTMESCLTRYYLLGNKGKTFLTEAF